jgi:hypothetical protein
MSQVDPTVFYWLDQDCNVTGILACHVDDFIWGGSPTFATTVIPHLKAVFQVGREEHDNCYVGIGFIAVDGTILMQQESYIKNLQLIHMDSSSATQRHSPLWN